MSKIKATDIKTGDVLVNGNLFRYIGKIYKKKLIEIGITYVDLFDSSGLKTSSVNINDLLIEIEIGRWELKKSEKKLFKDIWITSLGGYDYKLSPNNVLSINVYDDSGRYLFMTTEEKALKLIEEEFWTIKKK